MRLEHVPAETRRQVEIYFRGLSTYNRRIFVCWLRCESKDTFCSAWAEICGISTTAVRKHLTRFLRALLNLAGRNESELTLKDLHRRCQDRSTRSLITEEECASTLKEEGMESEDEISD